MNGAVDGAMNGAVDGAETARWALAIDVGGTFTDVIIADRRSGALHVAKTASTPGDQAGGFFDGVAQALALAGAGPGDIDVVLHGTTVATNAILEGKGARTGMLTTAGFRHALEIGRAEIPRGANLYGWVKPKRPVPPRHVFEARERVRADGSVALALDEDSVVAAADAMAAQGLEAVAIVFLHSYANPAHERRAAEILAARLPHAELSISSEVLPVFREYERAMATAINASVQPLVGRYVGRLADGLKARGIGAPLFIMKSNGGVFPPAQAAKLGAHLALSGPAAGARGAAHLGALAGITDMLTIDMGGTSADVALIRGGEPQITAATRINDQPLALPVIDIHAIGAGGGSLAFVAAHGAIRVGPESAGAAPGPAAYGRGGERPTVTDANLVLGRIPPHLLDGAVPLDVARARAAIEAHVARPLGASVEEAARGILAIVDETMTGALKVMSVERGLDPADFTLAAFGGAGPVHGAGLMRLLGAKALFVPRHPGILCAMGLLATDLRYDFVMTRLQRAGAYDLDAMTDGFAMLGAQAEARLAEDGAPPERCALSRAADMRYARQGVELSVPFPDGPVDADAAARAVARFHELHQRLYTFCDPAAPVEIVNLRVQAIGRADHIAPPEIAAAPSRRAEPAGERLAALIGAAPIPTPIHRREALLAGHEIEGPAIIDQLDSTVVILPGQIARVDRHGNLLVTEDGA
jgi:N-methylhydantoinase A